jgi:ribosomal protein S12 methylthiotransferase
MSTIALCNLGCSKNQIDGSRILEQFLASGYEQAEHIAAAQLIVVNTCAFIEAAKMEAIDKILEVAEYKKSGKCTQLIVCGCFSQRFRKIAAKRFPEVDVWAGVDDWPSRLAKYFKRHAQPSFYRVLESPRATQYLKIAEGCSHSCAFCAIPSIRGKFKSKTIDAIIEEATWLYSQGVKECVLVSQDTSFYGKDISSSLSRLLTEVLGQTRFPWIRMMYLHPLYVDEDLLRLIAKEPRICPYFDIPLQHGSDDILLAMKRKPLSKGIRGLIGNIRTIVPDAAIRTSFIVGFPGETDRRFEELVSFVEEIKFDKVGVFSFSPEEGTRAFTMKGRPRPKTATRRCETLMSLQREISEKINADRVGRTIDVIIDGPAEKPIVNDYTWEGRTRWDAPEVDGNIYVKGKGIKTGDIVTVKVLDNNDYDLFGEKVTSASRNVNR